jgi:hypothetical protein
MHGKAVSLSQEETVNIITLSPRTSPDAAARALVAAIAATGDTPPPTAALAGALTRWACRRAENLIDDAAEMYRRPAANADYIDLLATIQAARADTHVPRLITLRARRRAARAFAHEHSAHVQAWMLWNGWHTRIGCDLCNELGPAAPCWGAIGCHGYLMGCGCRGCLTGD